MAVKRLASGTYIVSCVGSDFLSFRNMYNTSFIQLYVIDYTPFPPFFIVSYNESFDLEYDEGSTLKYQRLSDSEGFEFKPLYPSGSELASVFSRLTDVFDRLGSLDTRLASIKTNTDRLP